MAVERALSTLWVARRSRGRVAEWPVTDPILSVLVLTQDNATAKSIPRMRRENREDAGRSDRTRPAADCQSQKAEGRTRGPGQRLFVRRTTNPRPGGGMAGG